jgi:hypothetical protein
MMPYPLKTEETTCSEYKIMNGDGLGVMCGNNDGKPQWRRDDYPGGYDYHDAERCALRCSTMAYHVRSLDKLISPGLNELTPELDIIVKELLGILLPQGGALVENEDLLGLACGLSSHIVLSKGREAPHPWPFLGTRRGWWWS